MSYGLNVEMHKQVSGRGDPKLLDRRDRRTVVEIGSVTLISGSDGEASLSVSATPHSFFKTMDGRFATWNRDRDRDGIDGGIKKARERERDIKLVPASLLLHDQKTGDR